MTTTPVEFDVQYTAELIHEAATSFVRKYLFKKYGRWLMLACIVNAAGFVLSLWLGANEPLVIAWLGAIVVLGPLYLFYVYFAYPGKFAARLRQVLLPSAHFSLSSEAFEVRTSAGSAAFQWSRVKSVLEFPSFFLLVLTPFAFSVIPKVGLPSEACASLQGRSAARVA